LDDFLSEQEQIDRVRGWLRSNILPIIGGVVLGLGVLFGWERFDNYKADQSIEASTLYQELSLYVLSDNDAEAISIFEQLRDTYGSSPYTDQAALLVAVMYLNNQNYRGSIDSLEYVIDNASDEYLSIIARFRLARVFMEQGQFEDAEALLDEEISGELVGRLNELRGDVYSALNNIEAARFAYTEALASDSQLINRSLIQMKMNDLDININ
tara:strand:- start:47094 stop:47729 length:636 start_codon:yes stop_codon:yes gene_type:complete